jgi:hypothetical protein
MVAKAMAIKSIQLLVLAAAVSLTGCGYGQFQTARTTPPGQVYVTAAQLYVTNKNSDQRVWLYEVPQEVDVRVGLSEQVDIGAKLFFLSGLLVDTKVNLVADQSAFAFALHGGLGAARIYTGSESDSAGVIHLPIGAIASYRLFGQLSPYVGFDYGFYWIFGRQLEYRDPKKVYAKRAGYGDGLGRVSVGIEWEVSKPLAFVFEYDLLLPLIDDPGDNFAFITNHIVGFGIRF